MKNFIKKLFNFGVEFGKDHVKDVGNTLISTIFNKIIMLIIIPMFMLGAGIGAIYFIIDLLTK